MDNNFNRIIVEYSSFREKLKTIINSSNSLIFNENCYLVDEKWENKLIFIINEFNKATSVESEIKIIKYFKNFINEETDFINDFSNIIFYLENNRNFSLVSQKLMEIIFKEMFLINFNYFKCIGKNNKLIIESKIKNENKSLLIAPFLNEQSNNNKYIILINNDNIKNNLNLYNKILQENNLDLLVIKMKNYIIPFKQYSNKNNILNNIYLYFLF